MKRLPSLLVLFLIVLTHLVSCTKNPQTPGSQTTITIASGTSSYDYVFSPEADWTTTASASWLSVFPASGSAGENITLQVSVGENTSYDARSANITITAVRVDVS